MIGTYKYGKVLEIDNFRIIFFWPLFLLIFFFFFTIICFLSFTSLKVTVYLVFSSMKFIYLFIFIFLCNPLVYVVFQLSNIWTKFYKHFCRTMAWLILVLTNTNNIHTTHNNSRKILVQNTKSKLSKNKS